MGLLCSQFKNVLRPKEAVKSAFQQIISMVKNYGEKHALKPTRMLGRLLKILKEFFFSFHSFCTEYLVYREGSTCIF